MTHGVFDNLKGRKFGWLTVIRRATSSEARRGVGTKAMWLVKCDCGQELLAVGMRLKNGRKKSCGINGHRWIVERADGAVRKADSLAYGSWEHMRARCLNPSHHKYARYGGRGITVCERWGKFENFLADMGPRPSKDHSIDRINNDGNYEPGNCRWATDEEQRRNQERSVFVEVDGLRVLLVDYAAKHGMKPGVVYSRLKLGWSVEEAIQVPVRPHKRKQP